jgi:tetratricopeptide (TPR) repeat protein
MEIYEKLQRKLQENLDLHGENHISNVLFYDKLANSQYSMNDFDEALSYLEKSYELQLSVLGESHEFVLDTDYKIGLLMSKSSKGYSSQYISRHMKRLLVSRIALDESVQSSIKPPFTSNAGVEYLDLMDSSMIYCDEAERQAASGNFSEAERFYKRCLQVRLAKFGPSHMTLSTIQRKYASLLLEMGKVHDATVLLEECLVSDSKHFGRQSERVADHIFALSHIHRIRERIGEALSLAQESLQIRRALLGEGHLLVTQTARVVAELQAETESAKTSHNAHRPQGMHHAQHQLQLQIETVDHNTSSNQLGHPAPPQTVDSNDIFNTSMSPLQPMTRPSGPSHPLATAGSETEDMLCEEIVIDRMYAKLLDDHAAQKRRTGQHSSNNADEGDGDGDLQHLQTLCSQLGESDGPEEDQLVEKQVLRKIDSLLFRIHAKILSVDDNDSSIHLVLDKVLGIVNMYSTPRLLMYVKYAVNRAHAMAYFKVYNFAMAMKFINPAVSGCPQANGYFVGGLADALVLLTGCHSSLGR